MLIDKAEVTLKGGDGGDGLVSFGKMLKSGPDGGNGGDGGDLYVRAVSDITLLNQFSVKSLFSGDDGRPGGKNKKSGKQGEDFELLLPVGTIIADAKTGVVITELTELGDRVFIAKGGRGGRGNWEFRSSRNTTPMSAESGKKGETRDVIIELKLIAQYGLIGLPNAGKSSLLNELTNANAKIANYPFTTLSPNLGVIKGKIIADIPGLIEGASTGRGLGISFLKHIEKVELLLHCISLESEDPMKDYKTVRKELEKYNKMLIEKPEIILLTKSDLSNAAKTKDFTRKFAKKNSKVLTISIHDWDSVRRLEKEL